MEELFSVDKRNIALLQDAEMLHFLEQSHLKVVMDDVDMVQVIL
jgi:hypothetical protein